MVLVGIMWYLCGFLGIISFWYIFYQIFNDGVIHQFLLNYFGSFPALIKWIVCISVFLFNFFFTVIFLSVCSNKLVLKLRNYMLKREKDFNG